MSVTRGIFILLVLIMACSSSTVMQHTAAIQAVPPSVALMPLTDKHNTGNFIHMNPFLTTSLLQALVEESENKKRVQRYRDVA